MYVYRVHETLKTINISNILITSIRVSNFEVVFNFSGFSLTTLSIIAPEIQNKHFVHDSG